MIVDTSAGLNSDSRFAYALAEAAREPLLFKGGDFARTDIAAARQAIVLPIR